MVMRATDEGKKKKRKKTKKKREKKKEEKKGKDGPKGYLPRWAQKLIFFLQKNCQERNRNEIEAPKKKQILSKENERK